MATQPQIHHRPGLNERQKKRLAQLEGKARITDFERGELAAFVYVGDTNESLQAQTVLDGHQPKEEK